jgi:hypothetical protein
MITAPKRQGGSEGWACNIADDDAARAMTVSLNFSLPCAMGRIMGDRPGRLDLKELEPSPFDACIADIEQKDHAGSLGDPAALPPIRDRPLCRCRATV